MKLQTSLFALLLACCASAYTHGQEAIEVGNASLINSLYQREWVRQDANGGISGRVVLIERSGNTVGSMDNKVVLAKDGVIAYEAKTQNDGTFEFSNVAPGAYALQASGDYTLAAFALHVLPASAEHLASSIDVFATTVGSKVREILAGNIIPADLEVGADDYYRSHSQDPIADERTFNRDHRVLLQNGDLIGRVSRPGWTFAEQDLSGSVAQVVRSGQVVAQAMVTRDGNYRIEGLEPGIYDMVISGSDGFAAFRFQAVSDLEPQENLASASSQAMLVSARLVNTVAADSLNSELIHQSDVYASPMPVDAGIVGLDGDCGMLESGCGTGVAPCCGGGFAGGGGFGGGGGGGGFGGGFGGGGLLGLGGLAGGIVALATSGGGTPPPPTPVAP